MNRDVMDKLRHQLSAPSTTTSVGVPGQILLSDEEKTLMSSTSYPFLARITVLPIIDENDVPTRCAVAL